MTIECNTEGPDRSVSYIGVSQSTHESWKVCIICKSVSVHIYTCLHYFVCVCVCVCVRVRADVRIKTVASYPGSSLEESQKKL